MADYFVSDVELTDVADAIREKGGTSAPLEWPGGFVEAIGDISGGGGSGGGSLSDPIRFFDYDGTLVASYTSVPSALPDNPSHDGLIAQGWNYTIAQIQTQFAASGTCDIGQMYITESGDTEIDIVLNDGRLSPYLGLAPNGTVVIDWGDGSAADTMTGTSLTSQKRTKHAYSTAGTYTIKVHVESGKVALYGTSAYTLLSNNSSSASGNRAYANTVQAVRVGNDTNIGNYAFINCCSLSSITLSSGVTGIGQYSFRYCYSLSSVIVPNGVLTIGNYAFSDCYSLSLAILPSGITNIGQYAFMYCYSLPSVVIPSSVTTIGRQAYNYCYGLRSVTLPDSLTSNNSAMFSSCFGLVSLRLPNNMTAISSQIASTCYSLTSITIPSSVTSIESSAFSGCYGLGEIHFLPTTPPRVDNSNAWNNVPTDCKIYVPAGSLSAYTSASNYPSSSTYTYIEE